MNTAAITVLLAALLAIPASACECGRPRNDGSFLHLAKDGSIDLPANALGVLFRQPATLDVLHSGGAVTILKSLPAKLNPKSFVMFDGTPPMKPVTVTLTPVDIDAQLGRPHTYYLAKGDLGALDAGTDLQRLARSHNLRDVSKEVQQATGLFRLAPAGGFVQGHTYEIMPSLEIWSGKLPRIRVGPPLAPGSGNSITLTRSGPPVAGLLEIAGGSMCSSKRAVVSQRIVYTLPKERQRYRHLLMTFTFEQPIPALQVGTVPTFEETSYRSDACGAGTFGTSEAGQGQELILNQCPAFGESTDVRLVRGYAGTLEIDAALQRVATIAVPFEPASRLRCTWLRWREDR